MNNPFYAVINRQDDGEIFCCGVFSNFEKALGHAVANITELYESSYTKTGDMFGISVPQFLEYNDGYMIKAAFKAACWEKAHTDYWYIVPAGDIHTEEVDHGDH